MYNQIIECKEENPARAKMICNLNLLDCKDFENVNIQKYRHYEVLSYEVLIPYNKDINKGQPCHI